MVSLFLWVSLCGCTHHPVMAPTVSDTTTPVSFSYQVLPIIESSCGVTTCHDAGTHQAGLTLSSYEAIRALVQPGDTTGSLLYERITASDTALRMPKEPELTLTSLQKVLLRNWILQGAPNSSVPTDTIDTTLISYRTTIAPIFEIHCRGCHNEFDHAGHFDATNIEHLRAYASDGTLLGVITHEKDYQPMPRNADTLGPMLSAADIARIQAWIDRGALDN